MDPSFFLFPCGPSAVRLRVHSFALFLFLFFLPVRNGLCGKRKEVIPTLAHVGVTGNSYSGPSEAKGEELYFDFFVLLRVSTSVLEWSGFSSSVAVCTVQINRWINN